MGSDLAQLLLNNQEPKLPLREDLDRWLTSVSKDHEVVCRSGQLHKVRLLPHRSEELKSQKLHRSSQFKISLRSLLSLSRPPILLNRRNSLQRMVVLR